MPNPAGKNNFGPSLEPYGSVKRQTELLREAPISGAPISGRALSAPKQAQRKAVRGQSQPRARERGRTLAPPAAPPILDPPESPGLTAAQVWAEVAALPGASDLVRWYAGQVNAQA